MTIPPFAKVLPASKIPATLMVWPYAVKVDPTVSLFLLANDLPMRATLALLLLDGAVPEVMVNLLPPATEALAKLFDAVIVIGIVKVWAVVVPPLDDCRSAAAGGGVVRV